MMLMAFVDDSAVKQGEWWTFDLHGLGTMPWSCAYWGGVSTWINSTSTVSRWNSKSCIQLACDMNFPGVIPCRTTNIVYQSIQSPKDVTNLTSTWSKMIWHNSKCNLPCFGCFSRSTVLPVHQVSLHRIAGSSEVGDPLWHWPKWFTLRPKFDEMMTDLRIDW